MLQGKNRDPACRAREQSTHGCAGYRVDPARRDLGERREHETPPLHARVRQLAWIMGDNLALIIEDIEVEGTRSGYYFVSCFASENALEVFEAREQGVRMTAHMANGDDIDEFTDEFTAEIIPDGLCSVESGDMADDRPAPMKLGQSAAQRLGGRAERTSAVGTDANINHRAGR